MKYILSLLLTMVSLHSCLKTNPVVNDGVLFEHIQGDWKTKIIRSGFRLRSFTFSFQDSICSYKQPWGEFSKYKIISDTLIIQKRGTSAFVDSNSITFKIEIFSKDSLKLIFISESAKDLFTKYQGFSESVTLYKILQKNNISPFKISFNSSGCYGTCPSMTLEIDNAQNIIFNGRKYTEKEKGHKGKISAAMYKNVLQQIRNLPLDSLKESYRAPWTDDQTCCIGLEFKNNSVNSCAYGYYKEPLELRILFHTLIELYKHLDLVTYDIGKNTINNQ